MGFKPQYLLTELHAIAIGIFLFLDETQIQSLRCCSWHWEIQVMMIWQFMRKFTLLHGAERVSSQYGNLRGFGHSITIYGLRWSRWMILEQKHFMFNMWHIWSLCITSVLPSPEHYFIYCGQENNINCHPRSQSLFTIWAYIIKLIFCYECDASIFVWKSFLFECKTQLHCIFAMVWCQIVGQYKDMIYIVWCYTSYSTCHNSFSILNQALLTSYISHFLQASIIWKHTARHHHT
jgi:hypothetical protein